MRTFARNQRPTQEAKSASYAKPGRAFSGQSGEIRSILHLQRTIGNQAVQRLLQPNAEELEAGSTNISSTRFAHDFSRIPLHAKAHAEIQPKLTVSAPGDTYDQEVDGGQTKSCTCLTLICNVFAPAAGNASSASGSKVAASNCR